MGRYMCSSRRRGFYRQLLHRSLDEGLAPEVAPGSVDVAVAVGVLSYVYNGSFSLNQVHTRTPPL